MERVQRRVPKIVKNASLAGPTAPANLLRNMTEMVAAAIHRNLQEPSFVCRIGAALEAPRPEERLVALNVRALRWFGDSRGPIHTRLIPAIKLARNPCDAVVRVVVFARNPMIRPLQRWVLRVEVG